MGSSSSGGGERSMALNGLDDGPETLRDHWIAIWMGIIFLVVGSIGLVALCGILPFPSPSLSPDQVLAIYRDNPIRMRIGVLLLFIGTMTFNQLYTIQFLHMRRVEGRFPIWSYTLLCTGIMAALPAWLASLLWLACTFRPDSDPGTILLLHDIGFLAFTFSTLPFVVIAQICYIIVFFRDRTQRVFPRWLAYMAVLDLLIFVPNALVPFFKSGPFAWNGVMGIYLPLTAYSVFMICFMTTVMRKRSPKS